ncbi:MAG TPA: hypothetical protein VK735_23055 [Pseudonocardia sp.]|jgi:hypothetical protein|nr:hypothetical protein [Pseudonocardia sp.]HTF50328.1 hypothetical protein [Pseudonocardia sp.]
MSESTPEATSPVRLVVTAIAWLWVLVPFLYGVWQLLIKVVPLFSR